MDDIQRSALVILIIIVICYIIYSCITRRKSNVPDTPNGNKENFAQALGTLYSRRKFYSKCVNNCDRNGDFKDLFAWTKITCHDKCSRDAENRVSDISTINRHVDCNNEQCYCEREVSEWCKTQICQYSNHPDCQSKCMKVNLYKCTSGLSWSWKP